MKIKMTVEQVEVYILLNVVGRDEEAEALIEKIKAVRKDKSEAPKAEEGK